MEVTDIAKVFELLIDEITQKKQGYQLLSASRLMQISAMIGRKVDSRQCKDTNDLSSKINQALQFIHKNYSHKISISELADLSHLSISRFSSIFKTVNGISPQQYLISLRIEKAVELMRRTSLNIHQVSALTGFENQLYFSRLFKKYKNLSPSEYIQKLSIEKD